YRDREAFGAREPQSRLRRDVLRRSARCELPMLGRYLASAQAARLAQAPFPPLTPEARVQQRRAEHIKELLRRAVELSGWIATKVCSKAERVAWLRGERLLNLVAETAEQKMRRLLGLEILGRLHAWQRLISARFGEEGDVVAATRVALDAAQVDYARRALLRVGRLGQVSARRVDRHAGNLELPPV